ncbi:MAG: hypothetical protein F2825_00155 [Actinobacteria bacterium]|nr:hypothetical protein [Actinomycetota bacterium]
MTATASTAEVRQWARSVGLIVGDRGRLSPDVLAAYRARVGGMPPGRNEDVVAPHDQAKQPPAGQLRITVRPVPGADGAGRRVTARAS